MSKKLSPKYINLILYIFLLKPGGFAHFPFLDNLFDYGRIVVVLFIVVRFLLGKHISKFIGVLIVSEFMLLISTILNDGSVLNYLKATLSGLGVAMLVDTSVKERNGEDLDLYAGYMAILGICNLISYIVLYPNGFGVSGNGWTAEYLLGIDNRFVYLLLPMVSSLCVCSLKKNHRLTLWWLLNYGLSLGLLIACWSVGAMLTMGLFGVCMVLFLRRADMEFPIRSSLVLLCILFIFFVILNDNLNLLADFIQNTLHKNPTLGRTFLWNTALSIFHRHPILGIGIQAESIQSMLFYPVSHPHDHYLYVLYTSGIVGLSLFVIQLCLSVRELYRYRYSLIAKCLSSTIVCTLFMLLADTFDYSGNFIMLLVLAYDVRYLVGQSKDVPAEETLPREWNRKLTRYREADDYVV